MAASKGQASHRSGGAARKKFTKADKKGKAGGKNPAVKGDKKSKKKGGKMPFGKK